MFILVKLFDFIAHYRTLHYQSEYDYLNPQTVFIIAYDEHSCHVKTKCRLWQTKFRWQRQRWELRQSIMHHSYSCDSNLRRPGWVLQLFHIASCALDYNIMLPLCHRNSLHCQFILECSDQHPYCRIVTGEDVVKHSVPASTELFTHGRQSLTQSKKFQEDRGKMALHCHQSLWALPLSVFQRNQFAAQHLQKNVELV